MDINMILAAFGGGVFGAILGGTGSFIFVGILGIAGVAAIVASGDATILGSIAFGPFFGPHIGFAGGVAAAAYAGNKKQYIASGADSLTPLAFTKDPMVLLVGGLFGIFGCVANLLYASVLPPMDTVALTVATSGIVARFLFGKSGLIGFKDQSAADTNGRYKISGSEFTFHLIVAVGLSLTVAYTALLIGVAEIGFVICASTLIFLYTNPGGGPVTHHIGITAGIAAIHTGNPVYGVVAGVIAFLLFEFLGARTLNKYNDTHIDPPAVAIAITSLLVFNVFPKG